MPLIWDIMDIYGISWVSVEGQFTKALKAAFIHIFLKYTALQKRAPHPLSKISFKNNQLKQTSRLQHRNSFKTKCINETPRFKTYEKHKKNLIFS